MGEILFLAHRVPFPPDRGDKIRSHHLLKALAALAPVHVACFADDEGDAAQEAELAQVAASHCLVERQRPLALAGLAALATRRPVSLAAFADSRIAGYVGRVLRERPISAIFVFSGQMGQYVPPGWAGRLVVDFVDVDSAKFGAYARSAAWPLRLVHAREERLLRAEEGRLAARASASLLVSEPETDLFRARLAPGLQAACNVVAMGNGIDGTVHDPDRTMPEPRLAPFARPRLIFTGQMDYPPNVAAVERAVTRIMPQVRAAHPEASFHVVGRKPTAAVLALDGLNGCRVWGRVDDVRPWLKGADAALIPLDLARGVQNKVLEAMAMGLPVIASPEAATGIAPGAAATILTGADDAALAAAVIALCADPARAWAIGQAARAQVLKAHAWPAMLAPLRRLLGRAENGAGPVERDAA